MAALDIVFGVITVASLVFAVYVYVESRKARAVESEKAVTADHRLADALTIVNAIAKQATLMSVLSDRDETTKKELKHHVISQLTMIEAAQDSLRRIKAHERAWRFGTTVGYIASGATDPSSETTPSRPELEVDESGSKDVG